MEVTSQGRYWIWPVYPINWDIVKTRNIWATDKELQTKKVRPRDVIVFYVQARGIFSGAFRVVSEWYRNDDELVWIEEVQEKRKKYPFECRLEPIIIGEAVLAELNSKLTFIANKANPGAYLMGTRSGPANFGRPIPEEDYETIINEMDKKPPASPISEEEVMQDHEEIVSKLLEIGTFMGFTASDRLEDTRIAKGAVVDVVWKLGIGNFGEIKYVFEVHLRGSPDSLILNLMRADQNPSVRGLVVVTQAEQIKSIMEETEALVNFRERLKFLTIDDVMKAHNNLNALSEFRNKLGLQV